MFECVKWWLFLSAFCSFFVSKIVFESDFGFSVLKFSNCVGCDSYVSRSKSKWDLTVEKNSKFYQKVLNIECVPNWNFYPLRKIVDLKFNDLPGATWFWFSRNSFTTIVKFKENCPILPINEFVVFTIILKILKFVFELFEMFLKNIQISNWACVKIVCQMKKSSFWIY